MAPAQRILIVISSLAGGGAERVAADLSRYFLERGRHVTLLTLNGDQPDDYATPAGVQRERIDIRHHPLSNFEKVRNVFSRMRAMRRKILGLNPDVVVSFVDQTNIRVILGLLGSRVPVIVSERVHPGHNLLTPFWHFLRRLTYPWAAAVTVQTEDGANWLRRFTRIKDAVVIANATRFDADVRATADARAPSVPRQLVLGMGRLAEQKGFDLLLHAFNQSGLAQSGWHLAILGEGPERAVLQGLVNSLGLSGSARLAGYSSDVGSWLRSADMFVLSSRFEGFPNALLEAMQVGVPCISFDCESGPRELIQDGVNGYLVRTEDIAALADRMRLLGGDPQLRARLGAEAARVSETFSPARIYGQWLDLIDAVAANEFDTRPRNATSAVAQKKESDARVRGQHGADS